MSSEISEHRDPPFAPARVSSSTTLAGSGMPSRLRCACVRAARSPGVGFRARPDRAAAPSPRWPAAPPRGRTPRGSPKRATSMAIANAFWRWRRPRAGRPTVSASIGLATIKLARHSIISARPDPLGPAIGQRYLRALRVGGRPAGRVKRPAPQAAARPGAALRPACLSTRCPTPGRGRRERGRTAPRSRPGPWTRPAARAPWYAICRDQRGGSDRRDAARRRAQRVVAERRRVVRGPHEREAYARRSRLVGSRFHRRAHGHRARGALRVDQHRGCAFREGLQLRRRVGRARPLRSSRDDAGCGIHRANPSRADWPRRARRTRWAACAGDMLFASNTSATKRRSASALTTTGGLGASLMETLGAGVAPHPLDTRAPSLPRKVLVQPVTQEVYHQRVALREHEMVHVRDEVQIGRLPGTGKEIERLLGRCHRVVGGMEQQQRTRRDRAHHVVGGERVVVSTTSNGNSMIEFCDRLPRSPGGIGTMS